MVRSADSDKPAVSARNARGFTLIELMIVVSILGILAAIAIPNFLAMQLRAKRAELPTNLEGMRTTELAYHHEWDAFTAASVTPASTPDREQHDFIGPGRAAFELLGWVPDGKVYGRYSAESWPAESTEFDGFFLQGNSDVDGDQMWATYVATRRGTPYMTTPNNRY